MKFNPNAFIPRLSVADQGPKRTVWFGFLEVTSQSVPYAGNFWRWFWTGELSGRETKYKLIRRVTWMKYSTGLF